MTMISPLMPAPSMQPITIQEGTVKVRVYESVRKHKSGKTYSLYVAQTCRYGQIYRRGRVELQDALVEARSLAKMLSKGERKAAKTSVRDIAYYQKCEKALNGTPLHVAVAFYQQHHFRPVNPTTVADVIRDYLRQLASDTTISRAHLVTRRSHLKQFGEALGSKQIANVTARELDAYLRNPGWQNTTRHNIRRTLIALFNYAQRKGWVDRQMKTEAELSEKIRTTDRPCHIYSVTELRAIFAQAGPGLKPLLALGAFAGLRTQEIMNLPWTAIDFKAGFIRMTRDITKTKRERLVPILPNLRAWLQDHRRKEGNVMHSLGINTGTALHEDFRTASSAAGIEWKHNGLRHSFASYYLAFTDDPGKTSMACGHTIAILESVYKSITVDDQPITKELAEEYFGIAPAK